MDPNTLSTIIHALSPSKHYSQEINNFMSDNGTLVLTAIAAAIEATRAEQSRNTQLALPNYTPMTRSLGDLVLFADNYFEEIFCLPRRTVQLMACRLQDEPNFICSDLLMLLHYLGSVDVTSENLAHQYGLSSVDEFYFRLIDVAKLVVALKDLANIVWPDDNEQMEIEQRFMEKYEFPGAIGVLDNFTINCKNNGKILVQVVCDHKFMYRDFYVTVNTNLQEAIDKWKLFNKIPTNPENDYHVVAPRDYPLRDHVLTPYMVEDGEEPNEEIVKFNNLHTKIQLHLNDCLRTTVNRFPRLVKLDIDSPTILASVFVFHNLALMTGAEQM